VAKGSISLQEKELQSVRRTEFLQATSNPIDLQIIGLMGRKALLEETAKAHGLDVEKLFPADIPAGAPPQGGVGTAPPPSTESGAVNQPAPGIEQFEGDNGR